jgi:hypothetical protein
MKNKSESLDNLTPSLAIRLHELSSADSPDIAGMSEEEFEGFCKTEGIHFSDRAAKRFLTVLEEAEARLRLEKARARLGLKKDSLDLVEALRTRIAALPIAEVVRKLKERLSSPGVPAGVYARNLETSTEEDLRSMLLDLERSTPHEEARDNQSTGDSL